MEELKTLKDLDLFWRIDTKKINGLQAQEELEQEAIKWIKYWQNFPKDNKQAIYVFKMFFDIMDEDLK